MGFFGKSQRCWNLCLTFCATPKSHILDEIQWNMIFLSICICNQRAELWICVSVWGCLCFGVLLHVGSVWERSLTCVSVWTDPWGVTFSTGVWLFDSFCGQAPHLMPHTSHTQSTCFQLTLHWAQIASVKGLFKCYLSMMGIMGEKITWN